LGRENENGSPDVCEGTASGSGDPVGVGVEVLVNVDGLCRVVECSPAGDNTTELVGEAPPVVNVVCAVGSCGAVVCAGLVWGEDSVHAVVVGGNTTRVVVAVWGFV